ncbi:MAG: AMP-binding protein [Paludibacteraceae bacterium]|nr:AMP-binding protein [Paludibacteraceae bacterium]
MNQHYFTYLSNIASRQWNDIALSDYGEEQQYTFGEMAATILRLHQLFKLLGIKEGDRIALCGRNCANWAVAYLAIMSYKAVVVSILQDFKAEDIDHLLSHSDSKLLFVGPYVWKDLSAQPLSGIEAAVNLADWSCLRAKDEENVPDADQLEASFRKLYPRGITAEDFRFDLDPDAMCLINYTSGSMGSPKGVMLNGRSLSNNVETGMSMLPVDPGQRLVSMLPLAHMFGQVCEFLYPLCCGTHIYFLTKSPTPSILLKALEDVKPYIVVTVPLVIEKIYKKNINPLLSRKVIKFFWRIPLTGPMIRRKVRKALTKAFGGELRYFICGGAPISPDVEACMKEIKFPISVGYGMTECGPLIGGNPPKYFVAHSGGVPVPNMEVMIDHPNQYGVGEILVRGENVMMGYYKNEAATIAAFTDDGWMRTGDLGCMDKHKNIFIKGRNKTMILGASGQNIYPEEIEDKLNNLEGVGESIIVEREGRLVGLVFPDEQTSRKMSIDDLRELMKQNVAKLNKLIPGYSQVSDIELKDEPFEKTPKKSIKRFMYK